MLQKAYRKAGKGYNRAKMTKSESSYRGKIGSKKALAVLLSSLEGFERPKVSVEQYLMDGEIAYGTPAVVKKDTKYGSRR